MTSARLAASRGFSAAQGFAKGCGTGLATCVGSTVAGTVVGSGPDLSIPYEAVRSGAAVMSRHMPSLPRGQIVRGVVNTPGAILRTARGEAPAIVNVRKREEKGTGRGGLGRKEHREREAATARPPWQLARGVEFRCSQVGEGPPRERSRAEPRASRREGLVLVARGSFGSCELTDSSWFLRSFVLAPCMRSCARIARRPFASDNCWDTRL